MSEIGELELADAVVSLAGALEASAAATAGLAKAQGRDGVDGKPGNPGAAGAVGPVGPAGRDGVNGKPGPVGLEGKPGPQGKQGPPGEDGVGPDEKVKVNAQDPTAGYLEDKLEPGLGVKFRRSTAGAIVIDAQGSAAGISVQAPGGGGPTLSNTVPLVESGSGAAGAGTKASRDDHIHPDGGGGGGGAPSGPAGGVLGGTYPNPDFAEDMATQAELDAAIAGVPAPPLADVLAAGNDAAGQAIVGVTTLTGVVDFDDPDPVELLGMAGTGADSGQHAVITGGGADGGGGAFIQASGGTPTEPGKLRIRTADLFGPGVLVSDAIDGSLTYAQAAFVEPTTATPEAIANALIAAGLMASV